MTTVTISLPTQIAKRVDAEAKKEGFATRSEKSFKLEEFEPVPLGQLKADLAHSGKYSEKFIESVMKGFEKSSLYAK